MKNILTTLLFMSVLASCGGSGGGSPTASGGGTGPSISLSTNTLVVGQTPTITITASDSIFSGSYSVKLAGLDCTSENVLSSTAIECSVPAGVTVSSGFNQVLVTSGDESARANYQVVAAAPRSETFSGFTQEGATLRTAGETDTITFDNSSLHAGVTNVGSKFYFSIDVDAVATASEQISNKCPEAGDEYYLINMSHKTLSVADNYLKLGAKLSFSSASSASLSFVSSLAQSSSTSYSVFCNENKEVTLYTSDAPPRIQEVYALVSNDKFVALRDLANTTLFVGMGNLTGGVAAINNISQIISSGGPYAYDGGRYNLDTGAYDLVGNNVSLVVGDLCDSGKNVIAGDDKLFIKSRELLTGGVATGLQWNNEQVFYYELKKLSSSHGIIQGVYQGDATLAGCVAKEYAAQAGNNKIVGSYLVGNGQLFFNLTNQAYNNTDLSIDAVYILH